MRVVNGKDQRQEALFADAIEPEQPAEPAKPPRAPVAGHFAGIVFNRPLDQVFSYRIPPSLREHLRPGQRVKVPLGRGNTVATGYCVRLDDFAEVDPKRVKDVIEILDDIPLIDAEMLELTRWIAGYYSCSWGQALDAVVPAGVKKQAGTRVATCLTVPPLIRENLPELLGSKTKITPKQAEVLKLLADRAEPLTVADVCKLANCATGPITLLKQRGLVQTVKVRLDTDTNDPPDPGNDPDTAPRPAPPLTAEQTTVLAKLAPALQGDKFATFLIHGVTGSGKTEVYLSAIEQVVARGREAIVLVPEISLTPQTIRRFRRRFPRVAVLHSHLSDAERHRHWRRIAAGEVQVVVGARSAVFAPTRKLGLIVIDEEHESSFKQETAPRYHARDVAVKRAQLERVPVLLGSATPALETWRNAELGRYEKLTLAERVSNRPMPEVSLIDLRHEKPPTIAISTALNDAMNRALDDKGQVILLLNRRGFHTFGVCVNPQCGQTLKCKDCDANLTYHQSRRKLVCHLCDAEREKILTCPSCQSKLFYGGIGTEQLEREVRSYFPDRVIKRMDSDTMRSPGSHERVLASFRAGEVDILLGTQMIAKGLDFPNVTLVGVINADTALHVPDFRAAERTFQLVAQVAGRTGRGDRPGKVYVQTFSPDVPAIHFARHHDYLGFVEGELRMREQQHLPPFGRLVRLIARGPDPGATQGYLDELALALREAAPPEVRVIGAFPAPVEKIRNLYRFQIRLSAPGPKPLQTLVQTVPPAMPPPSGIELAIDVDPLSML